MRTEQSADKNPIKYIISKLNIIPIKRNLTPTFFKNQNRKNVSFFNYIFNDTSKKSILKNEQKKIIF